VTGLVPAHGPSATAGLPTADVTADLRAVTILQQSPCGIGVRGVVS
jgi:hypothetical protein